MKRLIIALLVLTVLLVSCAPRYRTDITREEIVAAYEDQRKQQRQTQYDSKTDPAAYKGADQ